MSAYGRFRHGAAVLLCALILACSGSKKSATTTPVVDSPSETAIAATATPAPRPDLASQIGVRARLPVNDPFDLHARYTDGTLVPRTKPFSGEPAIGDHREFQKLELSGAVLAHSAPPVFTTVDATLVAKSEHAYFYEDSALGVPTADVQRAADAFESTVWPTVTAAFGQPDIPGIDGDPRIIVLQTDLGGGAGGYYIGDTAYPRSVRPLSNEAEMVYLDRGVRAGTERFTVVLAHEFQHLIHAHYDADEEAWVNEGLSEDALALVGGASTTTDSFAAKPSTQLNAFDTSGSLPHYGAGAAFFRYLASRFGGDPSLGAVAHQQRDGAAGVDDFLASAGTPLRFRDVFADWIVANILDEPSGRYSNPDRPVHAAVDNSLSPGRPVDGNATQFGTDYYSVDGLGGGDYVLRFRGQATTPVLPLAPPPGDSAQWWANAKDGIDTKLTRELDLTNATSPVLTFKTWYDTDPWFDWGYVSVSTDGGKTWRALPGDHTTDNDPAKQAYGPGYTTVSGGGTTPQWIDERVSLSEYAGKKVLLRFEYVTDPSVHGEGWAIDDLAVTGTDFRDPDGSAPGWTSEGWLRVDRPLPQTYVVRLIEKLSDGTSRVLDLPVAPDGNGELRFSAAGVSDATLAVAGSTEGTNQQAPYHLELTPG